MTRFRWALLTLFTAAAALLPGQTAHAQGTTTAVISGRIVDSDGRPLPNVEVRVTNEATGVVRSSLSNELGRYLVPGLPVGGPYTVAANALGFAAEQQTGLRLTLGQNLTVDFELAVQAVALQGIDVVADRTQGIINPGRTGAEQLVTERQIDNLPTITRNFTDFIQLSPLVGAGGGATSVGAQNNRFNNIQIDGTTTQDLFGLGSTGQPGGQAGARSISLEAVQEYQVLAAPFDIRQSGFSGGLINAVTKSGTNEYRGSVYGYYRNQDFSRDQLIVRADTFTFNDEFTNRLLGGSLGGPIIRDRAHFFVSAEFEADNRPGGNIAIGREAPTVTGVDPADAQRFADLLTGYGVNPGGFGTREDNSPNNNIFARVDAQLTPSHTLTLRHNWVRAEDDIAVNRGAGQNYSFDSNWYFFESSTNSSVLQLNSVFGGLFNEFTAGYTRIRDRRSPNEIFPVVQVRVPNLANPTAAKQLVAGAEYFSQGNELDQDALEFTNNLSFSRGNHRFTVGGQAQYFKFRNLFQAGKTGEWSFSSLDDLEAGLPNFFRRNVPVQGVEDPNARNSVLNAAIYAQTEWSGIENLVLTAGLRYDVPIAMGDDPLRNPLVESAIGRRTDEIASGNGLFSPRLGFNWDVMGDQTTQLRGGLGVFSGRQPYVWISNLYGNTGLATVQISCSGTGLPAFTADPDNQPTACVGAGGSPAPPSNPVINLIDPDFKYPQNFRTNLGIDHTLPFGIVGTVDFMYTRALNQIFLRELNVDFENPVSITQGGRPVFGTHVSGVISGSNNVNTASPNRISNDLAAVVELTNSDKDRSWSITTQAQKRYANGLDLNASYTYMDAEDVSGLTSSIATSNIGFNPVTGSPNSPILSTSDYETKHKVVLSGAYDVASWLTVSAFYVGASGDGYSYVYDGDVNADGFEASYASNRFNDLIYVPINEADITLTNPADWTALNQFISTESCLNENRGRIITRNACREPWQNRLDTRFTFRVPTMRSQRAEVSLDILNVLNLVNQDWGVIRGMPNPTADLLELRGWDDVNNRGIFRPTSFVRLDDDGNANPLTTFTGSSRWQMQVGVRYVF